MEQTDGVSDGQENGQKSLSAPAFLATTLKRAIFSPLLLPSRCGSESARGPVRRPHDRAADETFVE